MRFTRRAFWCFLLIVAAEPAFFEKACGQARQPGIRHRIDVVISAEPDAPLFQRLRGGVTGELSIAVRLSANSKESLFYGELHPAFPAVVVPDGPGKLLVQQIRIWEEGLCHQRRGLPKVTVTQVRGHFGEGESRLEISSVSRHIGLLVPSDELIPGAKLDQGRDDLGEFYSSRAQTRKSRLNVDLKIYLIDCFL